MIKLNCSLPKRLGGVASQSSGIVDPISDVILPMLKYQPRWLEIQRELGCGKLLSDTTAGQKVYQNLSSKIKTMEKNFNSTMAQVEKSHEATIQAALGGQAEEHKAEITKTLAEQKALEATCERVKKDGDERIMKAENECRQLREEERRRKMNEDRCTQEEKERLEREKEWNDRFWAYGVSAGGVVVTAGGLLLYKSIG